MRIRRRLWRGPAGVEMGARAERLIGRADTLQASGNPPPRAAVAGGSALGGRAEAIARCAERTGVPRGVRPRLEGYDPTFPPTCPAVLRVSAGGAAVHGIPGSRAFAEHGVAGLDCGVAFGARLAAHAEHGMLLTDYRPETRTPVREWGRFAGEIER